MLHLFLQSSKLIDNRFIHINVVGDRSDKTFALGMCSIKEFEWNTPEEDLEQMLKILMNTFLGQHSKYRNTDFKITIKNNKDMKELHMQILCLYFIAKANKIFKKGWTK